MPLAVGTKAPDFKLSTKTAEGPKQIKLSDNFGEKNSLLLFFPMAFTGTCTEEMCSVSNGLREWIIAADPVNNRVHPVVTRELLGRATHFFRTGAGEGHRKEKQHSVLLSEIVAEFDLLRSLRGLGR